MTYSADHRRCYKVSLVERVWTKVQACAKTGFVNAIKLLAGLLWLLFAFVGVPILASLFH